MKILNILLCGIVLVVISTFSIIFFYSTPYFDDFCHSYDIKSNGLWPSLKWFYLNWSGRYTSHFILSGHPLIFGSFIGYKALLFLYFLVFSISTWNLSAFWLKRNLINSNTIFLNLLFILGVFLFSPSLGDSILWLPGNIVYSLSISIYILFAILLIRALIDKSSKISQILIVCFLALILPGFNEIIIGYLFILLLLIPLISKELQISINSINFRRVYFPAFIFSMLGSLFALFAPGNFSRADVFEIKFDLIILLKGGLKSFLYQSITILSNPFVWIFSLTILIFFLLLLRTKAIRSNFSWKILAFLFLLWFLGHFPSFLLNYSPPPRLSHFLFVFYLGFQFYLLFTLAAIIYKYINKYLSLYSIKLILIFLIIISCFSSNLRNHFNSLYDGSYQQFLEMVNDRNDQLTRNNETVSIPKLNNIPVLLEFIDLKSHQDDPVNQCYCKYYQIEEIIVY